MTYFPEHESEDLARIRSEILRYRSTSLMNDRERADFLGLPEGCRIRENAKILAPENFVCGSNVWIGEGAILDAQGGLEIGDNTQIGLGVMVWSHTSHLQAISGETAQDKRHIDYKPTVIGRNCFVGGPTVIAPGVTIGDRAIISPMSFVEADVPPRGVVNGRTEFGALMKRVVALEEALQKLSLDLDGGPISS